MVLTSTDMEVYVSMIFMSRFPSFKHQKIFLCKLAFIRACIWGTWIFETMHMWRHAFVGASICDGMHLWGHAFVKGICCTYIYFMMLLVSFDYYWLYFPLPVHIFCHVTAKNRYSYHLFPLFCLHPCLNRKYLLRKIDIGTCSNMIFETWELIL